MIFIYNEFEDEESGHFVKPLPAGVTMKECHFNQTSQWVITQFVILESFQAFNIPSCFCLFCLFVFTVSIFGFYLPANF